MKKVKVDFDSNQGRWYYGEPGKANVVLPNKKKAAVNQGREKAKRLRDKFQQKVKLEIYKRDQNSLRDSPQKIKTYEPQTTRKSGDSGSYIDRKRGEFF